MQEWKMRTREIAYLLNPAFCGRILYTTIRAYNEKSHRAFPFPLVYLVLPLVLHKETRAIISSRTHLHIWAQQNPQLLIDFPQRARELIPITNEAVEMLLQTRKIILTPSGELEVPPRSKILKSIPILKLQNALRNVHISQGGLKMLGKSKTFTSVWG